MQQRIREIFQESIKTKQAALEKNLPLIEQAVQQILQSLKAGGKIFFFGNGGSAADSQHIAAEFIGRFQKERKSLPAIALTTDSSILTALGNDYGFDIVFARQLEGLAHKGDVAVAISTSGNSKNILEGLKQAKKMGVFTISFIGRDGGAQKNLSDLAIIVPSESTARIQESQLCIAHAICELVESQYFQ